MLFSCTIKTQNHTLPAVWHKILIQKFSSASAPGRQKFFKPCGDYAVAKIRKFPRFERTPIRNTRSMHDTAGPEIHLSLLCWSPICGSHVCVPGQLHHPSCPVWWHQSMVSASEARRRWKQWHKMYRVTDRWAVEFSQAVLERELLLLHCPFHRRPRGGPGMIEMCEICGFFLCEKWTNAHLW